LRVRRKAEERVNLAVGKKPLRGDRRTGYPFDVFGGVEPDIGGHGRQEHMGRGAQDWYSDRLALEVGDGADAIGREQLEAADMHPGDDGDLFASVDRDEPERRKM